MFFGGNNRARATDHFDARRDAVAKDEMVLAVDVKLDDACEVADFAEAVELLTESARRIDEFRAELKPEGSPTNVHPLFRPLSKVGAPDMSYGLVYGRDLGWKSNFPAIVAEMKRVCRSMGFVLLVETSKERVDQATSILPHATVTKFGMFRPVYVVEWMR